MQTKYVNENSTTSIPFAIMLNELLWTMPSGSEVDMMNFLYGTGQ